MVFPCVRKLCDKGLLATWTLIVTALPSAHIAAQVPLRVPIKCTALPSCGSAITIAEARASYNKRGKQELRAVARQAAPASEMTPIQRLVGQISRPNVGPLLSQNVCDAADVIGYYYFWAPVSKVADGESALRQLQSNVDSGDAHGRYINVEADHGSPAERHLAVCDITHIDGRAGAPRGCATVAIVTNRESWIRMGDTNQQICYTSASFRPSGAMSIRFNVKTSKEPQNLSDAIQKLLQDELALAVESQVLKSPEGKIHSIVLRSTSGLRDSKVLPAGWREILDLDVFIAQAVGLIEVRGTAHAMVSRQAVGRVAELAGLDDAQRTLYVNGLDARIENAIRRACSSFAKNDAASLECH